MTKEQIKQIGARLSHLQFTKEAREYYQLEKLWADAETVEINDSEND